MISGCASTFLLVRVAYVLQVILEEIRSSATLSHLFACVPFFSIIITEFKINMRCSSALHLVSDNESRFDDPATSTSQDKMLSSPTDVQGICDVVFGADSSFPNLPQVTTSIKRSRDEEGGPAENKTRRVSLSRSRASMRNLHVVGGDETSSFHELPMLSFLQSNSTGLISNASTESSATLCPNPLEEKDTNVSEGDTCNGYGWFVAADSDKDQQLKTSVDAYASYSNNDDLAFQVPVAPMRSKEEERELAWCTAADTVDDVLSEFF